MQVPQHMTSSRFPHGGRPGLFHGVDQRKKRILAHTDDKSELDSNSSASTSVVDLGLQVVDSTTSSVTSLVSNTRDLTGVNKVEVPLRIDDINADTGVVLEVSDGVTTVTDSTSAGATGEFTLSVDVSAITTGATITIKTGSDSLLDAVVKPITGILL